MFWMTFAFCHSEIYMSDLYINVPNCDLKKPAGKQKKNIKGLIFHGMQQPIRLCLMMAV